MNDPGAGQALFSFVRHWSRRWDGTGDCERAARGRDVLAVEAVNALAHRGEPTVNDVASELGLDQSNASRLLLMPPMPAILLSGDRRSISGGAPWL